MSDDQKNKHAPAADQKAGPDGVATPERQPQPEGGGAESPAADLQGLEERNAELQDQLLRKIAEFENFRKRMFRERDEGIRYANASLLEDLLPVIDGFERAIASAEKSRDFDALHDGVSLIERQLLSMLERNWGLKRFSAAGEPFDPQRHEAIAVQESNEHAEVVVLEDLLKGYSLHDRILRPAKVKVSRPAESGGSRSKNSTSVK